MMTSLQPVYVKHSALGANRNDSQLAYRLCMAVSAVVPGHVLGARQVRGLCMLSHAFLPDAFMRTSIIPILENNTGETSSKSNYRPIAIVTAM